MRTSAYGDKMRWLCVASVMITNILIGVLATAQPVRAATPVPAVQASHVYTAALPPTPVAPPDNNDDQRIIRGNKIVSNGSFTLNSNEVLQGDLTVVGGAALLEEGSRVEGSVSVIGGNLDAYGTITRDLTQIGGSVHLRSTLRVLGRQSIVGGSIQRDPGAYIAKQDTPPGNFSFNWNWPQAARQPMEQLAEMLRGFFAAIAGIIVITLLSVAIMALFPSNVALMTETARRQWLVAGSVGVLTDVAVPIVIILFAITICLIPAAIVLALAWGLAILAGWAVVARILGEWLVVGLSLRSWSPLARTALGAVILGILSALPIIGWVIGFLASAVGIGALILTRVGTQAYPRIVSVAQQAPAPPLPPSTG